MEYLFRKEIERIHQDLKCRQLMLQKSIQEYKDAEEWDSAMKCDIKARTLKLVEDRITNAFRL